MLRALLTTTILLVLPGGYASAEAPADTNAALQYWQAFAQLPHLSNAEERKLLDDCLTMPLDDHARDLVAKARYALLMMHRGAALRHCDWGIDYKNEGIEVLVPQGPAARALTSLACLRARLHVEDGHSAEAIDDLLDALTLGRQVSNKGVLLLVLVSYNIEQRVDELLARYLPKLDAAAIKELQKRIAGLPAGERPGTVMKIEEQADMDWLERRVKEAKGQEDLVKLFHLAATDEENRKGESAAKARALVEAAGGTQAGVLKAVEEVRPCYERMAKQLDLPPDQFEKEFAREEAQYANNPVFKVFFPALRKVYPAQERMNIRRAMLAAALAIQVDGPNALKDHPDPVLGGSFERIPFEGGYELRSRFKGKDDKPLSLIVGQRGK